MKSYCNKCNIETNQKVIFEKEKTVHYDPDDNFIINTYQIIECQGCNTISYRTLTRDKISSELSAYSNESPWSLSGKFPKSNIDQLILRKIDKMPKNLNTIIQETLRAYNSHCYILSASGIRSIIECLYAYQLISDKKCFIDIRTKIDQLAENGIVTKKNAAILHKLRFMGNKAIHELKTPAKEEIKLALEVIEITMLSLYQLESHGNRLNTM